MDATLTQSQGGSFTVEIFIDSVTASVEKQKELDNINSRNTAKPRLGIGV